MAYIQEYQFATHTIRIFFCKICGANVYNKSINPHFQYGKCAINVSEFLAVAHSPSLSSTVHDCLSLFEDCRRANRDTGIPIQVRLLHGIDLETIEVTKGDGKNLRLPPLEDNSL